MTHLTEQQFRQLSEGSLADETVADLLNHLDDCQVCLDRLDKWSVEGAVSPAMSESILTSDAFQQKIMRRIHREEAVRTLVHFSFRDILQVFAFLVRPFFSR